MYPPYWRAPGGFINDQPASWRSWRELGGHPRRDPWPHADAAHSSMKARTETCSMLGGPLGRAGSWCARPSRNGRQGRKRAFRGHTRAGSRRRRARRPIPCAPAVEELSKPRPGARRGGRTRRDACAHDADARKDLCHRIDDACRQLRYFCDTGHGTACSCRASYCGDCSESRKSARFC